MYYTKLNTQFCEIIMAGDEHGLAHLHLNTGEGNRQFIISEDWILNETFFEDVKNQIADYFNGTRKCFTVSINPRGTEFQKKVWTHLCQIPYGTLRSYADIAKAVGNKKAARAVGMANSKNPIPLIIPCHRVIGASGNLTGFASGLRMKERLIKLEQSV